MRPRKPLAALALLLLAPALALAAPPRNKGARTRPAAGELRVGVVGWSEDEKRLAVATEKLVDAGGDASSKRRPVELLVGVYPCPGFEMSDGQTILDVGLQGPKARASGWKEAKAYLASDGFPTEGLRTEPAPLRLTRAAAAEDRRLFELPASLGAGEGAKLELTVLEGNPVLTVLRPKAGAAGPERIKLKEYDAGAFELHRARCTLEIAPRGRCLALLCALGDERPYLGAYLLDTKRLRVTSE